MAKSIKIRAKMKGDETQVKCLMTHPMETGLRKDKKTGKLIPAHFINEVMAEFFAAGVHAIAERLGERPAARLLRFCGVIGLKHTFPDFLFIRIVCAGINVADTRSYQSRVNVIGKVVKGSLIIIRHADSHIANAVNRHVEVSRSGKISTGVI